MYFPQTLKEQQCRCLNGTQTVNAVNVPWSISLITCICPLSHCHYHISLVFKRKICSKWTSLYFNKRETAFSLRCISDSAADERMEVLLGPAAVTKAVGETVLLPCVVKGYPLPIIRWMLDGKVINER